MQIKSVAKFTMWTLGILLASCVVVGAIIWFTEPVTYSARTLVEFKPTPPSLLNPMDAVEYENYKKTQSMHLGRLRTGFAGVSRFVLIILAVAFLESRNRYVEPVSVAPRIGTG
jgi:hypothetical protein